MDSSTSAAMSSAGGGEGYDHYDTSQWPQQQQNPLPPPFPRKRKSSDDSSTLSEGVVGSGPSFPGSSSMGNCEEDERIKAIATQYLSRQESRGNVLGDGGVQAAPVLTKPPASQKKGGKLSGPLSGFQNPHPPHVAAQQRALLEAIYNNDAVTVGQLFKEGADPCLVSSGTCALAAAAGALPINPQICALCVRGAVAVRGSAGAEDALSNGQLRQSQLQSLAKALNRTIYGKGRRFTNRELAVSILGYLDTPRNASPAPQQSEVAQPSFGYSGHTSSGESNSGALGINTSAPESANVSPNMSPHYRAYVVHEASANYDSALQNACAVGDIGAIEARLTDAKVGKGASVQALLSVTDAEGNTLLHWAARGAQIASIKMLLSAGADPESLNNAGRSPIHAAVEQGDKACMLQLLRGYASKYSSRAEATDRLSGADRDTPSSAPFMRKDLQKMCRLLNRTVYGSTNGSSKQLRNEQLADAILEDAEGAEPGGLVYLGVKRDKAAAKASKGASPPRKQARANSPEQPMSLSHQTPSQPQSAEPGPLATSKLWASFAPSASTHTAADASHGGSLSTASTSGSKRPREESAAAADPIVRKTSPQTGPVLGRSFGATPPPSFFSQTAPGAGRGHATHGGPVPVPVPMNVPPVVQMISPPVASFAPVAGWGEMQPMGVVQYSNAVGNGLNANDSGVIRLLKEKLEASERGRAELEVKVIELSRKLRAAELENQLRSSGGSAPGAASMAP